MSVINMRHKHSVSSLILVFLEIVRLSGMEEGKSFDLLLI